MKLHGLAIAIVVCLTLGGCGSGHSATTRLIQTEERAGISHDLAVCVANAVQVELGDSAVRELTSNLNQASASMQTALTRITAHCANSTVTVKAPPPG